MLDPPKRDDHIIVSKNPMGTSEDEETDMGIIPSSIQGLFSPSCANIRRRQYHKSSLNGVDWKCEILVDERLDNIFLRFRITAGT